MCDLQDFVHALSSMICACLLYVYTYLDAISADGVYGRSKTTKLDTLAAPHYKT